MVEESLIAAIKQLGVEKKYSKDEYLFFAGQDATGFYYILSGEIRLFKMDENARELELRRFGSGNFIGEIILFASDIFPVFAQAVKSSSLIFFPKNRIIEELEQNATLSKLLLTLYAKRCLALSNIIESTKFKTIRYKLIEYLVSLCGKEGACLIELKDRKIDIAKQLGTISETLSRNLKILEAEGLIRVEGRKIFILNCVQLQKEIKPS